MRYISTRGRAAPLSFFEALLAGLASDGGLFVPEAWPVFEPDEIAAFAAMPYARSAADILGRFIGEEIPRERLRAICEEAYANFDDPAVAPLEPLRPGVYLLKLFLGPTLAFKDIAMQLLARLYEHALGGRDRQMTIVCATSGDTGGAAVEAFRGRRNIRIVALFPEGRISEIQRRFMTTPEDANVRVVAIGGDFDDCQSILKALFSDGIFALEVGLSAVNSINFARIAAQTVYYFTAAAALGAPERASVFAVPTGNFGDAFAAWAARRMGLPIERVIVATNGNDIVARALETGRYERGAVLATQSPAMDIQVASNFERLYFECSGRDAGETAAAFRNFAESGGIALPDRVQTGARALFSAASVSEPATSGCILETFGRTGVLVDPHTAVALAAAESMGLEPSDHPLVILSTAHPAKFPDAVRSASGKSPCLPKAAAELAGRPERFARLPAEVGAVKAFVRAFASGGEAA
ncbi:MAG: threonine synthase [Caulobacteraceae bacterium]